jgi:glutaminyl-peptide cyclotransferase
LRRKTRTLKRERHERGWRLKTGVRNFRTAFPVYGFLLALLLCFGCVENPPECGPAGDTGPPPGSEGEDETGGEGEGEAAIVDWGYEITAVYPHDPDAFCQGLVYGDALFYESTGQYGSSTLRKVEPETGLPVQILSLGDKYFGEGIALAGEEIFQLTWREQVCFVYAKNDFSLLREMPYDTDGWGLAWDGEHLIMSDGSPTLYYRDPATFEETARINVCADGEPVRWLNELEYINGEIFANVWRSDRIARIDPASGAVTGWIHLGGLLTEEEAAGADVLNGIAWDPEGSRLFVTGKDWPKLFEITLKPL